VADLAPVDPAVDLPPAQDGREPTPAEERLPRSRPESTRPTATRDASGKLPGPEPATPIRLVALDPLYVDVWNADERHYDISGTSPDLLVASATASIPTDPTGAARHTMAYAGPIVWQHTPTYTIDPSTQACTMTGVASTVRYQATVPVWTSPGNVPPELVAWWQLVLEHIREHEGEHVRIFQMYVDALPDRLAGQPCASWEVIVTAWTGEIEAAQAAFDATEAGWTLPPYAGPTDS
jgi:predicted secreted Zn-dependent protease